MRACIHTYIYTYTYFQVVPFFTSLRAGDLHVHTYVHIHIHTFTHTYIHTYTHTHTSRSCPFSRAYVQETYMYTHIHTHTNIYIYTHIHTYIYKYTYFQVVSFFASLRARDLDSVKKFVFSDPNLVLTVEESLHRAETPLHVAATVGQ